MEETQAKMYWIKQKLETKTESWGGEGKAGYSSVELVRDIHHILG